MRKSTLDEIRKLVKLNPSSVVKDDRVCLDNSFYPDDISVDSSGEVCLCPQAQEPSPTSQCSAELRHDRARESQRGCRHSQHRVKGVFGPSGGTSYRRHSISEHAQSLTLHFARVLHTGVCARQLLHPEALGHGYWRSAGCRWHAAHT